MSVLDLPPLDGSPLKRALFDVLETDREELPSSGGTALRGSFAYRCSRQVSFEVLGVSKDHDPDGAALAAFEVGHAWHDVIQRALVDGYGADIEVDVDLRPEWDCSTHCDAVYDGARRDEPVDGLVSTEIKSKSGYAYNLLCKGLKGTWAKNKTEPIGPEAADVVQAGLSALGLGASWLHIIYVSKDISGELTEWLVGMDEPLRHLGGYTPRELVVGDLQRLSEVVELAGRSVVAERFVPGTGLVGSPPAHKDEGGKGQPWQCRYCAWNATCRGLPAEAVEVDVQVSS